MQTNCDVIWTNNITNKEIVRNIPIYVYLGDREEAEDALRKGHLVCIDEYGCIAFISPYIARSERMAQAKEILIYPDGRVIHKLHSED